MTLPPLSPKPHRVRNITLIALIVGILASVVGVVVWQQRKPNSPSLQATLEMSTAYLEVLPAARFSVEYTDIHAQQVTGKFVITREGQVVGTVNDVVEGQAQIRAGSQGIIVRGDQAWWSRRDPKRVSELMDRWITPTSGLAFGVAIEKMLNFDNLVHLQQRVMKNNPHRQSLGQINGEEQFLITGDNWSFRYTSGKVPRLLGMSSTQFRVTDKTKSFGGGGYAPAELPQAPPSGGSAIFNPHVDIKVEKSPTTQEIRKTQEAVPQGKPVPDSKGSTPEPVKQADVPVPAMLVPALTSSPSCNTPICTHTAQVTNMGGRPSGMATVVLTAVPGGMTSTVLPPLQPGGSSSVSLTHSNPAPPGGVVSGMTFVSVQQAGVDAPQNVLDSLHNRLGPQVLNRPELVTLDAPLKGMIHQAVDVMTRQAQIDVLNGENPLVDEFVENALTATRFATRQQLLPDLAAITRVKNLQNPEDVALHLAEMQRVYDVGDPSYLGQLREFQDVALQAKLYPEATLVYDGLYVVDGKEYKADRILEDLDSGKREAVQTKSVRTRRNFVPYLRKAIDQLNGNAGPDADGRVEKAPPGYDRIALMYIENPSQTATGPATDMRSERNRWQSRSEFARDLANLHRNDKDLYCRDGKPRVEKIIVVNNAGVHEFSLKDLEIRC